MELGVVKPLACCICCHANTAMLQCQQQLHDARCTMHFASAAWHARSRIWFVCRHLQGQATHSRSCLGAKEGVKEEAPCLGLLAMPINRTCTWTPMASVGCFMGPGRESSALYASLSAVYAPLGHFLKLFMAAAGKGKKKEGAQRGHKSEANTGQKSTNSREPKTL